MGQDTWNKGDGDAGVKTDYVGPKRTSVLAPVLPTYSQ